MKKRIGIIYFFISISILQSCSVYTFSGASIPENVKSISIRTFENNAPIVFPNLNQNFTEALKQKVTSFTTLDLNNTGGDVQMEGEISDYSIRPVAITGNEVSANARLTIAIRVKYTDTKNVKNSWNQTFSRYIDFPSSQQLSAVEANLSKEVTTLIVEDIFNKAFVNW